MLRMMRCGSVGGLELSPFYRSSTTFIAPDASVGPVGLVVYINFVVGQHVSRTPANSLPRLQATVTFLVLGEYFVSMGNSLTRAIYITRLYIYSHVI